MASLCSQQVVMIVGQILIPEMIPSLGVSDLKESSSVDSRAGVAVEHGGCILVLLTSFAALALECVMHVTECVLVKSKQFSHVVLGKVSFDIFPLIHDTG